MALQYMTRKVEFTGAFQPHLPDVDAMLDEAARGGWRLVQILPSLNVGTSWEALFVFMRE